MKINKAGIELIKRFEGCILKAYKCPANVWTIGYGHTSDVKEGDKITMQQAESLLLIDLASRERFIDSLNLGFNENQFSALVSLVYNIGQGNFNKSPLFAQLKKDKNDLKNIELGFNRHVYGGGKKLPGLIKRRKAEFELYSTS